MNFKSRLFSIAICATVLFSCKEEATTAKSTMQNLIPKPVSATATNEFFSLTKETGIFIQSDDTKDIQVGQWFADKLKPATGFDLKVSLPNEEPKAGGIFL